MTVHCWKGYTEWLKEQPGADADEVDAEMFDQMTKTCLLPDGHAGPHEWTNDSDISVRFLPTQEDK